MSVSSIQGVANSCRKAIHSVAVDAHIDRQNKLMQGCGRYSPDFTLFSPPLYERGHIKPSLSEKGDRVSGG